MPKAWCWAPLAIALVPGAALAAGAAPPPASQWPRNVTVNVDGGAANPDGTGLKGNTSVDVQLAGGVDAKVTGAFSSDPSNPAQPGDRTDQKFGLATALNGPAGVRFAISANSQTHVDRQEGVLMPAGLARTTVTTQENSATAAATIEPFDGARVTAGVSERHTLTTQNNLPVGGSPQNSSVTVDDRQAFASLQWTPIQLLTINASGKLETAQATSQATAHAADDFRYAEPSVSAAVHPWTGGTLTASAEEAVSPINTGDFAALAEAAGPDTALRLAPNREWHNQTSFTQTFDNGASISVSGTQANLQSTTELTLADLGAAPVSVSGGTRREFDASLSVPLSGIGLSNTSVTSQAKWQQSQIRDPLTGQIRRASGEIPREAQIRITHEDNAHHLEWGVTGDLGTRQTIYQPAEIAKLHTGSGIGAFVRYKPVNNYVVSLNANGLVGGARSQTAWLYSGSREGNLESVNRTSDASPLVSLSVSRAF